MTRAPVSTVAMFAGWSWNLAAATTSPAATFGTMAATPAARPSTASAAAGTSIDSGVRCLASSVSPVSSFASAAIRGSSPGGSPSP